MSAVKLALIQTNPTIGDIRGNVERVLARLRDAASAGAQLAVFPEQTILGYPAKDLLLRRDVIERNVAAVQQIADAADDLAAVVGFAEPTDRALGRPVYNSVALVHRGRILARSRKRLLPTYDVFDEVRYFEPGGPQPLIAFGGIPFGITVCEDMWSREEMLGQPLYDCDPIGDVVRAGARVILNVSASPYFLDKHDVRVSLMADHARRNHVPLMFVNQVGGNDELIFDGASTVVDAAGNLIALARTFDEDMLLVDVDSNVDAGCTSPLSPCHIVTLSPAPIAAHPAGPAALHDALVLGLRDYVRKCGFRHVVLGLSGGIDSAVVAALAAAALGPQNVHGVAMPSRYSSDHSVNDARALAENLGIRFSIISIEAAHAAFEQSLAPQFAGRPPDIAEENIQARTRGGILMALSNKFGSLLLTTGNKSELAVGYCTLYGDMCGGLAVISDVPKTMIYALARHMNARTGREIIPRSTIDKPPSAELKPNQTDQDTLPPYEVLDEILDRYEVRLESRDAIVAAGFEPQVVDDVLRKIHISEYKRQQAAPGLKVTSRAFGFGRRMPIAARRP